MKMKWRRNKCYQIYNMIYIFHYRKLFNMEEILKNNPEKDNASRDLSKCKNMVDKSLSLFGKISDPDHDFLTEIEYLDDFKTEVFHLLKVRIIKCLASIFIMF